MGRKRRDAEAQRAKALRHRNNAKTDHPVGAWFYGHRVVLSPLPLRLCASAFQFLFPVLGLFPRGVRSHVLEHQCPFVQDGRSRWRSLQAGVFDVERAVATANFREAPLTLVSHIAQPEGDATHDNSRFLLVGEVNVLEADAVFIRRAFDADVKAVNRQVFDKARPGSARAIK